MKDSSHLHLSPKPISLAVALALLMLAGCHKQVAVSHPPPAPQPAAPSQPTTVAKTVPPVPVQAAPRTVSATPDQQTKDTIQALLNRIQDIYFDYDQHALRPDAQSTLQADAQTLRQILQQYPTYKLTVEGFCDERGSDEYNMALGDARAKKAQAFLESLGLPSSQLRTVSFGKEKPVCTDHDEACWQKNRRAHITQDQG